MPKRHLWYAMHWASRAQQYHRTVAVGKESRLAKFRSRTKTAGGRSFTLAPHSGFSKTSHIWNTVRVTPSNRKIRHWNFANKCSVVLLQSLSTLRRDISWHNSFFKKTHTRVFYILKFQHVYLIFISSLNWKTHMKKPNSLLFPSVEFAATPRSQN